jgi:SnoaL-like protein
LVNGSPIEQLLGALDNLDAEAALALFTSDGRVLTADGRRAAGRDAVNELLSEFLGGLRSMTHRITAQWHQEDAWIAEVEGTYELRDWLKVGPLPRALVLRAGPDGISEMHVYGAHERPLADHGTGEGGFWIADHWIAPL